MIYKDKVYDVEYKLTATVDGEQVYVYSGFSIEQIEMALHNAEDAVDYKLATLGGSSD